VKNDEREGANEEKVEHRRSGFHGGNAGNEKFGELLLLPLSNRR
jgi:hypothetical protein